MPEDRVVRPRRALVSVTDKQGLVPFVRALVERDVEILSTGGTARHLRDAGLPVREIADYTGSPEILDGRVKTLHPKVHGGILAVRDNPKHVSQMEAHAISPIDLVVVNLYQFEQAAARPGLERAAVVEEIDIGGPCLIRAAAKNARDVIVVTDPAQYAPLLEEMAGAAGGVSEASRLELARAAFQRTAHYDAAIAEWLATGSGGEVAHARPADASRPAASAAPAHGDSPFPPRFAPAYAKVMDLRYGENPHQLAALYREEAAAAGPGLPSGEFLSGKELSYNNLLDLESALALVREFDAPTVVIVKHNNPCGVGSAETLAAAFWKAYETDPVSAFGGVLALNRPVDIETLDAIAAPEHFLEAMVAPEFAPEAVEILARRVKWGKKCRLLAVGPWTGPAAAGWDVRSLSGGLLVQTRDDSLLAPAGLTVATTEPTADQRRDLLFAWKVAKHVRSNALVLAHGEAVVGVGAGQMSRVDSAYIAVRKAGDRARGSVMASDAFFPFSDALQVAIDAGVRAVIQPGGSIRDAEVIETARRYGVAMLLTGRRHFRH
ncbi:MAG: bifunctional phosphoribosylaminoimidazolecarboxamide formyltransferase/IMP cyclohydrolase [Planctomycetes bacterium]|nr:bifunctional phosphoribosylaminoimidazolecarboxamide formyltransferase/IMP cyclohydrolase [Planctomycetota bacterium]